MKKEEKITGLISNDNFAGKSVQYESEVEDMDKDFDGYCEIYRELCQLVGEVNMKKIHSRFKGITVQFPKQLYSYEFRKRFIIENKQVMKTRDLSKALNLTERRIQQIIKELEEE